MHIGVELGTAWNWIGINISIGHWPLLVLVLKREPTYPMLIIGGHMFLDMKPKQDA